MADERILCHLHDIPDGKARGFPGLPGGFMGLLAVRRGAAVFVYVNSCPHIGVPLEMMPDRFLDGAGRHILCAVHGASFRIEDGYCLSGPCLGDSLEAVPARVDPEGMIRVPADAGA